MGASIVPSMALIRALLSLLTFCLIPQPALAGVTRNYEFNVRACFICHFWSLKKILLWIYFFCFIINMHFVLLILL